MRVYVAGSSAEIDRAEQVMQAIERAGHVVVSTWTEDIASVGEANPRDASAEERRGWARGCLRQVGGSDALVFLVPREPATTRGGWAEMAYAFRSQIPILCSGDTKQSVFCALGDEVELDAEIVPWLEEIARGT